METLGHICYVQPVTFTSVKLQACAQIDARWCSTPAHFPLTSSVNFILYLNFKLVSNFKKQRIITLSDKTVRPHLDRKQQEASLSLFSRIMLNSFILSGLILTELFKVLRVWCCSVDLTLSSPVSIVFKVYLWLFKKWSAQATCPLTDCRLRLKLCQAEAHRFFN